MRDFVPRANIACDFLQVLYDALLCLGYDGEVATSCGRLSMVDGLDICETSMTIPLSLADPWTGIIVGSEPDTTIE
jgi:hypothetical protein